MVHVTVGIRAPCRNRRHGLPRSHGPRRSIDTPKVKIRLTRQRKAALGANGKIRSTHSPKADPAAVARRLRTPASAPPSSREPDRGRVRGLALHAARYRLTFGIGGRALLAVGGSPLASPTSSARLDAFADEL